MHDELRGTRSRGPLCGRKRMQVLGSAAVASVLLLAGAQASLADAPLSVTSTGYPGYGSYFDDDSFLDNHGLIGFNGSDRVATYISFDLSGITDPIDSASISFVLGPYRPPQVETLVVHAVTTPLATLEAGNGTFSQVVGGTVVALGSIGPATSSPHIVDLNQLGLDELDLAAGVDEVTFGVELSTAQGPSEAVAGFAIATALQITLPEPDLHLVQMTALAALSLLIHARCRPKQHPIC